MIAWWWLLVAAGVLWSVLFVVVLVRDSQVRETAGAVLLSVVTAPLVVLYFLLDRADTATIPLSARAVSRFAAARSADPRRAWLFWSRGRGILIVRGWELGSDRPVVRVRVRDEESL